MTTRKKTAFSNAKFFSTLRRSAFEFKRTRRVAFFILSCATTWGASAQEFPAQEYQPQGTVQGIPQDFSQAPGVVYPNDGAIYPNGEQFGNFNGVPLHGMTSFDGGFVNSLPLDGNFQSFGGTPNLGGLPQETSVDGMIMLGDVTGEIPVGNFNYDSIPFLEEQRPTEQRKLPELRVPQNDKEFNERLEALRKRFANPPLSTQNSTPGRLLRYSLVAGADETFLTSKGLLIEEASAKNANNLDKVYALGALCWNLNCAGETPLRLVDGKLYPKIGAEFQQQRGEFLAALAFAQIDRNYEIRVGEKSLTVQDLVECEKKRCSVYANLSTLAIGLAYYSQDPDEEWIAESGEKWSLARLFKHEYARRVDWGAADSIDRLLALSYLLARLKQSRHIAEPEFAETLKTAQTYLMSIKKLAWELIGENVLCESLFFAADVKLTTPYMRLYVNGKLLRWLVLVSTQEELQSEKMKKACAEVCALVDQLFNSLDSLDQTSPIDEESLGTALHALQLYRGRAAK